MKSIIITLLLFPFFLMAQSNLPDEVRVTDEGTLKHGGTKVEGFYNVSNVHKLEITLTEPDWFTLMDGEGGGGPGGGGGATEGELLIGVLTVNDVMVFDSVVVGIKGNTSDFRNDSEKKSFKIYMDEYIKQDLMGYDNLNLNCAYEDHSFMREVLYCDISRGFSTALKGSFVDLYINGDYWGPYNNIQQLEGSFIKEWFANNNGTRWRALNSAPVAGGGPGGGPGGGGPDPERFGAGVSSLNFNGTDTTDYTQNYQLKSTTKENPWEDLMAVCEPLNSAPIADLYEVLNPILDIDRTLWFLAQEIVVSDDDGYFFKGGMDYYVYWDHATGRLMPMEVDGNSIMDPRNADWSPFFRDDDDRFPLIHRMLQNEEIRQRYLAHLRTVLADHFVPAKVHERIDEFAAILDQRVQDDPKKIYSYAEFIAGVEELKGFVTERAEFLLQNEEIDREGVSILEVARTTASGGEDVVSGESVTITAEISGNAQAVKLYHAQGLDGKYDRLSMSDDGTSGDLVAGDNIYTGIIPPASEGVFTRYYIEAIKEDDFGTATYWPVGAEHESYIYQTSYSIVAGDVVINEVMASNSSTATDISGGAGDWVELYNKGDEATDLSGFHLTDDEEELDKWAFPENTVLGAGEYIIIWADSDEEDTTPDELHTNFNLNAGGESVLLIDENSNVTDRIDFDEQFTDVSFARIPNATGDFSFRTPTFNANNDSSMTHTIDIGHSTRLKIYPNPANQVITIEVLAGQVDELMIYDVLGQFQSSIDGSFNSAQKLDVSNLETGMYFLHFVNENNQVFTKRVSIVR